MIDTHCHLTYPGLYERVDEVVNDAHRRGVDRLISVGTSPDDAEKAVALAERVPMVYATAGLHPCHADEVPDPEALKDRLRALLLNPKVVALGEMGLDRHHPEPPIEVQKPVFAAQLELMHAYPRVPGVIHNRGATDDTLAMIAASGVAGERFVFHCFGGTADELDRILAIGARVSFTGIVTFNGAKDLARASDRVPLDRLMIETDSPYLTPAPHRKVRINEPQYVRFVASFLAARRGMSVEEFTAAVDANAEAFFGLGGEG